MDPRPRQPPAGLPPPAADLDSTDELPVLDVTAYEAAARERLDDTWIQPGTSGSGIAPDTRAGAEDPLQTAVANLREAQELLKGRAARLSELEHSLEDAHAARGAAERNATRLAEELNEARSRAAQLETEHAAEQTEARLARERSAAEHAAALAEARALAERREAELGEELARARAAAGLKASELTEELARARRTAEEEKAAAERRLSEERSAGSEAQRASDLALEELRSRAATYFESLSSAERRRSLLEGMVSDLQDEAGTYEASRERLARELVGRDTRTTELESDLAQRVARIAALEGQVATTGAALEQRETELERLRTAQASVNSALEAARAAAAVVSTRAAEQEAALTEARARIATLEAELAAERKRAAEREQELTTVRGEMEQWAGALRAAQLERSGHLAGIAAGEARVKQLEDRVVEQAETMKALQTASDAAIARGHELEADVRAAEEGIARLESQLRARNARVAELEKANQQWRYTLEETRARHAQTDTHHVLPDAAHPEEEGGKLREAADGGTRLLIQSDGERDVMHVLGRKTSIGRTPDNDLRIDAKYISRHHAVILVGAAHAIIEDLNSTNGVTVNGRRVTRQELRDGDQVVIGRAQYRFAVRRTEKR
ncbi:MAG TPA: FHA domain-containing protein [Steroidobacteraceae bacterium]|nr:FHA domain-containing protein [Steroidobacteraceae bacterium]